jgi:hypothetical protein
MSFVKWRIEFPDRDLSAADAAVSTLAAADLHKRFRNCATVLRRADPNSDSVIQGERGSSQYSADISVRGRRIWLAAFAIPPTGGDVPSGIFLPRHRRGHQKPAARSDPSPS